MVEHIVLIKWLPGTSPEAVAAVVEGLKALKETVPGIVDLVVGENYSARSQGYQTGLVVRFVDRAACDNYGPHPAHQHVVQNLINPHKADVINVDFDIDESRV